MSKPCPRARLSTSVEAHHPGAPIYQPRVNTATVATNPRTTDSTAILTTTHTSAAREYCCSVAKSAVGFGRTALNNRYALQGMARIPRSIAACIRTNSPRSRKADTISGRSDHLAPTRKRRRKTSATTIRNPTTAAVFCQRLIGEYGEPTDASNVNEARVGRQCGSAAVCRETSLTTTTVTKVHEREMLIWRLCEPSWSCGRKPP